VHSPHRDEIGFYSIINWSLMFFCCLRAIYHKLCASKIFYWLTKHMNEESALVKGGLRLENPGFVTWKFCPWQLGSLLLITS